MNVLFLTLVQFESIQQSGIYTDLLREFVCNGHKVYAVSPVEKRYGKETHLIEEKNAAILQLQIGNTQKTNLIEKGISTLRIEPLFISGIKKYFSDVKFDLILYSTPPITLVGAVEYVKKRDGAKTYLMLKDIFPQNAVDLGMMRKTGWKSVLYSYFRRKEKKLYALSDYIGCMSEANVEYVLANNREVADRNRAEKPIVGLCPNCVEPREVCLTDAEKKELREKYALPLDKKVFVYGGNLGKPQDIPFMIDCLDAMRDNTEAFFLVVGSGTEYSLIDTYVKEKKPQNMALYNSLPKEDYDRLVAACDVGMIFLDHRFTIPNFPSRLLAYMQAKIPVLALTDENTDVGQVITGKDLNGKSTHQSFGWWSNSANVAGFCDMVQEALSADLVALGEAGYRYLLSHYTAKEAYKRIWETL